MSSPSSSSQGMGRFDVGLFVVGVIGLVLFFTLLPSQHPDGAARLSLSEEEVVARARAFVYDSGFMISGVLEEDADVVRDVQLLDSIQTALGRPQAVEMLRGQATLPPAYQWRVEWTEDDARELAVMTTLGGAVYAFHTDPSVEPVSRLDRRALRSLLPGAEATPAGADTLLAALSDSLLISALTLRLDDGPGSATGSRLDRTALERLDAGEPFALDARAAEVLARHHLRRTVYDGMHLVLDSVRAAVRPGVSAADVHLRAEGPRLGHRVRIAVTVTATGGLLAVVPTFDSMRSAAVVPAAEDDAEPAEGSLSLDDLVAVIALALYVLVFLVVLFVFGRRFSVRLIDSNAAFRDGLWGAVFAATLVLVNVAPEILGTAPQPVFGYLISGLVVVVASLFGLLVVYIASGAMDSVGRAVWEEKLVAFSLVRHGVVRNVPVGAALVRGTAAGFVLLGGVTVLLATFPQALLRMESGVEPLVGQALFQLVGTAFAGSALLGLFATLTVVMGVGALLYRWRPSAWVVVPGVALVLAAMQVSPLEVEPVLYAPAFYGFVGLVMAYTFWRFDFVATFTAYLTFGLLWGTAGGWLVEGLPHALDALLASLFVGVVLALGVVGLLSRRAATEVPSFVPAYVQELAREERLKREIEIAQKVQEALLPRRTPKVAGVDVAAMCLPALDVGGDYYDFVEIAPGRLAVVVGDVSGKGIQAAFYMTLTKGFLQSLCRTVDSPAEVLRRVNALFCENVPRGTFISMIYGVLDVEARTFTFARAGHNPVILKRSPSRATELYRPDGLGIGLVSGPRFDAAITEEVLHLRPGDALVFYTDGFSEAMNAHKELYGDARLADRVSETGQRTANEILRAVAEDVHHFVEAAGRRDDMTMVVLKLNPLPVHAGHASARAADQPA